MNIEFYYYDVEATSTNLGATKADQLDLDVPTLYHTQGFPAYTKLAVDTQRTHNHQQTEWC